MISSLQPTRPAVTVAVSPADDADPFNLHVQALVNGAKGTRASKRGLLAAAEVAVGATQQSESTNRYARTVSAASRYARTVPAASHCPLLPLTAGKRVRGARLHAAKSGFRDL